jgi:hypothetical protein
MSDRVELSIRQFSGAWRLMCNACPEPVIEDREGMECIFASLPIPFFNVVLLTERGISSEALRSLGRDACAWASDKGVPWLFLVTHDALRPGVDAGAILDGCGLAPLMPMTGMIAQQVAPLVRVPQGLQLTVPQDDAGCSAVLDVNSAAYGVDLGAGRDSLGRRSFWKDHVLVVGLVLGKPACSTGVMMVDGHRYVALVATDPGQQRRGYADAAMRRALEISAREHGPRPTVLHASEAGRPVYERMGYDAISTHTLFMEKRFLAGH